MASPITGLGANIQRQSTTEQAAEVTLEADGRPCVIDATGPAYDAARSAFTAAWDGTAPVDVGIGGSIPFVATFQELFPMRRFWSPVLKTPMPGHTCTWASSSGSAWLRRYCSRMFAEALTS